MVASRLPPSNRSETESSESEGRAAIFLALALDAGLSPVLTATYEGSGGSGGFRRAERRQASMMGRDGEEEKAKIDCAEVLVYNQPE